ncbi:hypothetical protein ACLOJK_038884 [Asimina triloba]
MSNLIHESQPSNEFVLSSWECGVLTANIRISTLHLGGPQSKVYSAIHFSAVFICPFHFPNTRCQSSRADRLALIHKISHFYGTEKMAPMTKYTTIFSLFFSILTAQFSSYFSSQVYVVYMGSKNSDNPDENFSRDNQMLASVHGGSFEDALSSHVYSYVHGFRGFAARLTEEQASAMAKMPGVVSVFPNLKRSLHTTRSWDFMGLVNDESMEIPGFPTKNQQNVIIGFIDTALAFIWTPENFIDHVMLIKLLDNAFLTEYGQSPAVSMISICRQCLVDGKGSVKLVKHSKIHLATGLYNELNCKDKCRNASGLEILPSSFLLNFVYDHRKIIGARYYLNGYNAEEPSDQGNSEKVVKFRSPRDSSGHGSHTASTAAGRYVDNMNFNGLAAGGARGGAPTARIAVYKTCWDSGCYDADLLAAFDDAIKDGVDILSLSLGPDFPQGDYLNDAISVGSFHAATHGILVVSSVGNEGSQGSATNLAPWMVTVAATSMDRDFTSSIILGNGRNFSGESLSLFAMNRSSRLMYAADAYAGYFTPYQSSYCLESSLNSTKVRGKVLVCHHVDSSTESKLAKSIVVKNAGGVGMILVDESDKDVAIPFVIPSAIVGSADGNRILSYINHTRRPTALILPTKTVLGSQPAPRVASFSSKGPNALTPEILKPDVSAPGLNILAAWSPAVNKMNFNILSGTSMACPHVTGIAALIKSVYPTWSPAAIKSALMTTGTMLDINGKAIRANPNGRLANPFDFGSGFVNPTEVLNPGLVYDLQPTDYTDFLCSVGYDDQSIGKITGEKTVCHQPSPSVLDFNYPSITVPNLKGSQTVTRTVTNVGKPRSIYKAAVSPPRGINVTVEPKYLIFNYYGQKINFSVNFKVTAPSKGYVFGSLSWKNRELRVRSPLVVGVATSHSGMSR